MQDDAYFIDQELGAATLECLDPSWEEAQLVIDLAGGGVRVSLAPVGREGVAMPSDEVYEAVGKLVKYHRDNATDLESAVYTFRRRPDGKWHFVGDFVYPP